MCDYCNPDYNETPGDMSGQIEHYGHGAYGLTITIHNESYAIVPINFCPICGRKLTED